MHCIKAAVQKTIREDVLNKHRLKCILESNLLSFCLFVRLTTSTTSNLKGRNDNLLVFYFMEAHFDTQTSSLVVFMLLGLSKPAL